MRTFWRAAAWSAALGALGCGDGVGVGAGGTTRLTLQLTDAPGDVFASATIDIGAIVLKAQGGPALTLTEDAGEFDLLDLQDGVTATLASLDVPAGRYHQVRLVVESASVILADGLTFADGSTTQALVVPSGARSGLKVNLFGGDESTGGRGGVEFAPGETILVLDFDVSRNFVLTGPREAPTGALFKPLIRATVRDVAGNISGRVTDAASGAPVAGRTVRATLVESPVLEDLQTAEATAVTADDGTYTLWFLSPGTYTVSVDGAAAPAQTVVIDQGELVTGVDFATAP